jgi:hypothetical protein
MKSVPWSPARGSTVEGVPNKRSALCCEMHSDLMPEGRAGAGLDESVGATFFENDKSSVARASSEHGRDADLAPVACVMFQRKLNCTVFWKDTPRHNGQVALLDGTSRKRTTKFLEGCLVFCGEH